MHRQEGLSILIAVITLIVTVVNSQEPACDTGRGWQKLGPRWKCYKVFYERNDIRTWDRARDICKSYGSRLVNIDSQYESDELGTLVESKTGGSADFWIGLSNVLEDGCTSCPRLQWHMGPVITENQGFWDNNQPDDEDQNCVFASRQKVKMTMTYVYDRPVVWSFDKCVRRRAFVCEKKAIPEGTFPCFTSGYARFQDVCDGKSNCKDSSDELDCPSHFRYYHKGPSGTLTPLVYANIRTYYWAIETPIGTNVLLQFRNLQTDGNADVVTVFVGSIIESYATPIAQLSGNQGNKQYRSFNNLMLIKFSTDLAGTSSGFTATWDSLVIQDTEISLVATTTPKTYTLDTVSISNTEAYLGLADLVIVIKTERERDEIITLEIKNMVLQDSDSVIFFNGDKPDSSVLATMCNNGCDNQELVYSTGTSMSVMLRTGPQTGNNIQFSFTYRQGCYYETTEQWGEVFSPGYPAGIGYPNSITCRWIINSPFPIAFKFDGNTQLKDEDLGRDSLKIFDNETALHTGQGFSTSDLLIETILITTGRATLEFVTSPTRTARGFKATWSKDCPNPMYDSTTRLNTGTVRVYYTALMTLSCERGHAFLQDQIPPGTTQVNLECGFKGQWLNYGEIPRCSPVFCNEVASINNGYIAYSTGSVYGNIAHYECYPGSTLTGSSTGNITCEDNGVWSRPPTCEAARCAFNAGSMQILNGVFEVTLGDGSEIGSIIEYTCNDGYELVGEPILHCQNNGTYSQGPPSCRALTCSLPEVTYQIDWTTNPLTFGGVTAALFCQNGYEVSDPSLNPITCQANRTVTQVAQCVNIDECTTQSPCAQKCADNEGSYSCSCNDGYVLQPDQKNCRDINECIVNNGNCDDLCTNLAGTYECSCFLPNVLYGADGTSGFMIPPGEDGLKPTDIFHINHTCVLKECPTPSNTVPNAMLLTKQEHFRVGDCIEYQCNLGYTSSSRLQTCESNGQWSGTVPDCVAAECPEDPEGQDPNLENAAAYNRGALAYGERLYLNCTLAQDQFSIYRYCTYNNELDTYQLQGAPYDCGVIDCGQPEALPGATYEGLTDTTYDSSFVVRCSDAVSGSSQQGDTTVRCLADGNWDFGSLRCRVSSCEDPGFPAGGDIIADSLSAGSEVNFKCNRPGYVLSHSAPLICNGNSFAGSPAVPVCIDNEDPVFTNCNKEVTLPLFTLLASYLPSFTVPDNSAVTDNTGIEDLIVSPINANISYYVTSDTSITYTAIDYAKNTATCNVVVKVKDETPPSVNCPDRRDLLLSDSETTKQTEIIIAASDDIGIKSESIIPNPLQEEFSAEDLYRTVTYKATVTDTSNNEATCQGQILVLPSQCSDRSLTTPLNSQKNCRGITGGRECDVTCDEDYTFPNGKSLTFTCLFFTGEWQDVVPACIRDITKPEIVCPSSAEISFTTTPAIIDFTGLTVVRSDANDLQDPVFSQLSMEFGAQQLYQTTRVQVSVADIASNTATCDFEYTLLPSLCSPSSFRQPLNANPNVCTATGSGFSCDVECFDGYVLRGFSQRETFTCTTGQPWSNVFTSCIEDKIPPTLQCPFSSSVYINNGDDVRTVDTQDEFPDYSASDNSGGQIRILYNPSQMEISSTHLNQLSRSVTVTAIDGNNNAMSCSFEVVVLANQCSPLSLAEPVNGQKQCSDSCTKESCQCNITCNNGYIFHDRTDTLITTSCANDNPFSTYIPGCVPEFQAVEKQFVVSLNYQYIPDDGTANVPEGCYNGYRSEQIFRSTDMAGRLKTACENTYTYRIGVAFIEGSFTSEIINDANGNKRIAQIKSQFTLDNLQPGDDDLEAFSACAQRYTNTVGSSAAIYTFNRDLEGDGESCPIMTFQFGEVTDSSTSCFVPNFESPNNSDLCLPCPTGTESDSVQCTLCGIGEYSTDSGCQSCGTGTTRYPGSNVCVSPCVEGTYSVSGYQPCFQCPVGSFSSSTTSCESCPTGMTTRFSGSPNNGSCQSISSVTVTEACPQGTTSDGADGCTLCPEGTYGVSTTPACQPCQPQGTSYTFIEGATSISACRVMCSGGMYSNTGKAPCTACPKGTSWFNSTHCEPCPEGQTTDGTGAVSCISKTVLRVNCPRGTFRNQTTQDCQNCPRDAYNPFEERIGCTDCGNNKGTFWEGATSFDQCYDKCAPGFFSTDGMSPCTPCGTGFYWTSSTECQRCPNDGTTLNPTAMSIAECYTPCPPGQFSVNGYNVDGSCRQCPPNHYQPNSRSTSCIRCPNDKFSTQFGGTSTESCLSTDSMCINKCQNGGTCSINFNTYFCECPIGFYGRNCEGVVDYCKSDPCFNGGICTSSPQGHSCTCPVGTTGDDCQNIVKTCVASTATIEGTCRNGDCINYVGSTKCLCPEGFIGDTCNVPADICVTDPCNNIGTERCEDVSFDLDLRRKCICKNGYTGRDCETNIDDCALTPCINGGTCVDQTGSFSCTCKNGYFGSYCENRANRCAGVFCSANSMCVDDYYTDQQRCICEPGYAYDTYVEHKLYKNMAPSNLGTIASEIKDTARACINACNALSQCTVVSYDHTSKECYFPIDSQAIPSLISTNDVSTYEKQEEQRDGDFWTEMYDTDSPSVANNFWDVTRLSDLNGKYGLNICDGTEPLAARCCIKGGSCDISNHPLGMQCDAAGSICTSGINQPPCPDFEVQFKCAAHRVFSSNTCSKKNDYCSSNPCQNGGFCTSVDGVGHRCSCQPGYAGLNCQTNVDDCESGPCQNGGTCTDLVNSFSCECATGFGGIDCSNPVNYCALNSVRCSFHGGCMNRPEGSYCDCFIGYFGENCENEINFCESNPCIHGGTCQPLLNSYECSCEDGYTGINCEVIVDNCAGGGDLACNAECYNLFDNYYCKCPPNTYGRNCEHQPDPCGNYNMCINGGQCSFSGGSMSCDCPTRYHGDGCERLKDLCGPNSPCQNNAVCSLTTDGYQCTCAPGFTGMDCDVDINECSSNPCSAGAECREDIGRYFCMCPLGKTGTDCLRDYNPNYDLAFNHPEGLAYAWIPYFIDVININQMSVSLWVRYLVPGSEGVFMTEFRGARLESASKFMEFTELGVKIYVNFGTSDHIFAPFPTTVIVNDGEWHLVHLLYDMLAGKVVVFADTIRSSDEKTAPGLIRPNNSYKMWLVLGCSFDNEDMACTGENSFNGYLSQVNLYRRLLTFERMGNEQGEITANYQTPLSVFGNTAERLAVWNSYTLGPEVNIISPSQASGTICSVRNPPDSCDSYPATQLPSVSNCPDDIVKDTSKFERFITVRWSEPTFNNLLNYNIEASAKSGDSFGWGETTVTYVASSSDGYKLYCSFNVIVRNRPCERPPNPFSGSQTCVDNNPIGWKGCNIRCLSSQTSVRKIDRYHPVQFTCGRSGRWNTARPYSHTFRYPSCGVVQSRPKVDFFLRLVYKISSSACRAVSDTLKEKIRQKLDDINNQHAGLCKETTCSDVKINPICNNNPVQSGSTFVTLVNINFERVEATYSLAGEDVTIEELLRYFILDEKDLDFGDIADGDVDGSNFYSEFTHTCSDGHVLIDDDCVECGPGNYFSSISTPAICEDCPLGYYQDNTGTTSCKKCPDGLTTELTGTFDLGDCKKNCSVGQYYDDGANDCLPCEIGFYQELTGQFSCNPCDVGFTTEDTGSDSPVKCINTCPSGQQIKSDVCVDCPIGQYRDATQTRVCVNCPTGLTTQDTASTSQSDCNIPACLKGNMYNAPTNSCMPCPVGQYQDEDYQTSCKSCGSPSNWSTPGIASQSLTDCFYYCPSGYTATNANTCIICEIGFYKDNNEGLQGVCEPCVGNYRTEERGSVSSANCTIYKCGVGYEADDTNTGCDACQLGFYQDVPYSIDCKECPDEESTRTTASNSSSDCEKYCPSGYEKDVDETCKSCERGSFKDNNLGLFSTCTACDPFFTTDVLAAPSEDSCKIPTCPPGTERNDDDTGCIGCELGTYQPEAFQESCLPCDSGTSTRQVNSTAKDQCEVYCPSGQELIGPGQCEDCVVGYYKDNNDGFFGTCTLCPIESITSGTGSTSISDCNIANCTSGSYLTTNNQCEECAKGFYQPEWWKASCIQCDVFKTTELPGADREELCILECPPGLEGAGDVCQPCAQGYWKSEQAATSCKECPNGKTTEGTGSTSINECTLPSCLEGQYLDRTGPNSPTCQLCPYDTFNDLIWQESCTSCPQGQVTLQRGADSSGYCVTNCSSGTEYNSGTRQCDFCPIGYYRNQFIRTQVDCQMCNIQYITDNVGATDISQCTAANCTTPGRYRDTATETCRFCPQDTYNSQKWLTECSECPNGYGTRSTGSTEIADCNRICNPGTYLAQTGFCVECPRGSYSSNPRADICTPCPDGLLTPNPGQTSPATCVISPCSAGESYSRVSRICSACPRGTYQPNGGQFECIDCPFLIKFTPRTGATSENECRSPCGRGEEFNTVSQTCQQCPRGYYQPGNNQFSCIQCEEGKRFTVSTGSTSVAQCLSPCADNAIHGCSENASCAIDAADVRGYKCACFLNFEDVGSSAGNQCVHKCDRNYCGNGGTCSARDPTPVCSCSEYYEGNRCQRRLRGDELDDDTLDIVIPVAIAVGGVLLFLILLAVCILCRRLGAPKGNKPQYTDYYGDRVDKASLQSYEYGQQPFRGNGSNRLVMASLPEVTYNNPGFKPDMDHGSNLDTAVYEA